MSAPVLSRRSLGKAAGALVLAFAMRPPLGFGEEAAHLPGSLDTNRMLDAWIRINADGTATVFTGKAELGQGNVTALAQIAAEELDLPMAKVTIVTADTALTPNEGFTAGSQSIEYGGTALRLAAAETRAILLDRAAAQLGAPANDLRVADGVVSGPGGKTIGYGKLVAAGMLHKEVSAKVPPKLPAEYKIVGKSIGRLDIPAKVTGGAIFVQDMRLDGMVFGRVVRPPSYGATLVSVDEAAAKAMPGIVAVVRDGSFLGIVAEREEQAIAGREALRKSATWTETHTMPAPDGLSAFLRGAAAESAVVSEKKGTITPARTIEASYSKRYVAHASIGPSCAVAQLKDGALHVWTHGQGVFPLRDDIAKAMAMPIEAITCTHAQGSGCYGHNGADDAALDAALLARATGGRPVKLQWMRDDEFAWEPFGSAMATSVKAGLAEDGTIVDWQYDVWSNTHNYRPGVKGGTNLAAAWALATPQSPTKPAGIPQPAGAEDRNAIPLYDFPSQKVTKHLVLEMPLRVSALRTLGAYANVFATESFMDELAAAAGADPVEYRLRHLKDPRAKAVIEAVAQKAGWQKGGKGDGSRGRGIAFAKYKNLSTYVAVIADVEVDRKTGDIAVPRVFAAVDAGLIISPDGLENQIEGGIIQSASWTTREEVTFDKQRVTSLDWAGYTILTFPEVPKVEIVLLDRPGEKSLGSGEASQGPTAAAIANAVAHATGKRLRDLPLTPERVQAALA
jgi:CO/xanthine dehydrogenase Mo-binding subunit